MFFNPIFCLFILYYLFDVNYIFRTVAVIIAARFRKKIRLLDSSELYGIVLPSDVDMFLTHMNNGRVLREYDFARFDHLLRSGAHALLSEGGSGVVAAHVIRYRKPIYLFSTYKVVTHPMYWDSKSIYIEQRIVTLRDEIVRCVSYLKLSFTFDVNQKVSIIFPDLEKPTTMPDDFSKWMEYNELSSQRMNSTK